MHAMKRSVFLIVSRFKEMLRCFINKHIRKNMVLQYDQIHLGCGNIHLRNFINVDYRATKAADIAMNCVYLDYFHPQSISLIYSCAFFEHVYRLERVTCLENCYRILKIDGILLFMGVPDFYQVAKAYLNKEKGIFHKTFDAFEVYRYTHGDPEQVPDWWLEQLHKSLLDKETMDILLQQSGFKYYCIFNYIFADDTIPLNMGVIAFKNKPEIKITTRWLYSYIRAIDKNNTNTHAIIIRLLHL